ncbi:MAG: TIR domain-containing protein [Verrucomicrobiaceae bacterium]|nr:TIR domain-containing protein [Verrucomicrobiaceae bacterium]
MSTAPTNVTNPPKVFISYSWSTPAYKELVLDIADRLIKDDRVEVVVDEYDLKGGQDIVAFMERLKTDSTITHVLVLSDAAYAAKADSRKRGVGTEAQILSADVYNDIGQTRVVPVLMERTPDGDPCLPTFLRTRMYFDFSSTESMHREWEKLGRHLWGKPIRTKPSLGESPKYLTIEAGGAFVGMKRTWAALRAALMDGKPGVAVLRDEFLDLFENELLEACGGSQLKTDDNADVRRRWEDCLHAQIEPRELLLEWALSEARIDAENAVRRCLIPLLERVNAIPRESDNSPTCSAVRDAMAVLGYEMALYAVAVLLEVDAPAALRMLLVHPFPERGRYRESMHAALSEFCHYSQFMEHWNQKQEQKWISPIAERVLQRCTHTRLNRERVIEAEAVVFLANVLNDTRWYPYTAVYSSRGTKFPWFQKAKSGKEPDRLGIISGRANWKTVRDEFLAKFQSITSNSSWAVFQSWWPKLLPGAHGF